MSFLARSCYQAPHSEVIMRGLPFQKLNNHFPLQFRVSFQSVGTPSPEATEFCFWFHQGPSPSNYQLWNTFKKKLIFKLLLLLLKGASSKLTISFAVSMLSCAYQMPPASWPHPCQQSVPLTERLLCASQKPKTSFSSLNTHVKGLTYKVTESPKLHSQVVETSHSPWTTCLLGQALPHSVFAASCTRLLAYKQHF